jgi:hypothetical protein
VLTSSRQPRDVARAYALGAHDYQVLPASMHDLCVVVDDIEAYWESLRRQGATSKARRG